MMSRRCTRVSEWQARAGGHVPATLGVSHDMRSVSRMCRSLSHFSPSWPPWMKILVRATTTLMWLLRVAGMVPGWFGLCNE